MANRSAPQIDLVNLFTKKAPSFIYELKNMESVLGAGAQQTLEKVGQILAKRVAELSLASTLPSADINNVLEALGKSPNDLLDMSIFSIPPLIVPRWLFERETSIGPTLSISTEGSECVDWIKGRTSHHNSATLRHVDEELDDILTSPFAECHVSLDNNGDIVANYLVPPTLRLSAWQLFMGFSGVYDYTIPVPPTFDKAHFFVFALNHEIAHLLRLNINPDQDITYLSRQNSMDRSVSSGRDVEGFCDCLATLKHIQTTGDTDFPELIGQLRTMSILNRSAEKTVVLGKFGEKRRPAIEYDTQPHIDAAIQYARNCKEDIANLSDEDLIAISYQIMAQERLDEPTLRQMEKLVYAPFYSQSTPSPREVQARLDEIENLGCIKPRGIEVLVQSFAPRAEGELDPMNVRPLGEQERRLINAHRQALGRMDGSVEDEIKQQYFLRFVEGLSDTIGSAYNLSPLATLLQQHEDLLRMASGWVGYQLRGRPYKIEGMDFTPEFYEKTMFPRGRREAKFLDDDEDTRKALISSNMLHGVVSVIFEAYTKSLPPTSPNPLTFISPRC